MGTTSNVCNLRLMKGEVTLSLPAQDGGSPQCLDIHTCPYPQDKSFASLIEQENLCSEMSMVFPWKASELSCNRVPYPTWMMDRGNMEIKTGEVIGEGRSSHN